MILNNRKAWQKKLQKLKDDHQSKDTAPKAVADKPNALLKQVNALQLLRDMKQFLLDGVGKIEVVENTSGYDLILVLMWNGTISKPEMPRPNSKARQHIFIGVRKDELYVNGKQVAFTEKDLKNALFEAAENLGSRKSDAGK